MLLSTSPDMAQEIMKQVDTEVYLDDITTFSQTFDSHILLLDIILPHLQGNGFSVNPLKCEWTVQETDFLGHWLMPDGIKLYPKNINTIINMEPPNQL